MKWLKQIEMKKWLKQIKMNARKLGSWWPGADLWSAGDAPVRVEEPPFVPFDLSPIRAERRAGLPADTAPEAARPPATLVELGVPPELAQSLDVVFRALGATEGGQVTGFRFRTLDGASHSLRLDDAA
jgi:hypothetical protein